MKTGGRKPCAEKSACRTTPFNGAASLLPMKPVFAFRSMQRAKGLLGTNEAWGHGQRVLVIAPCKSVHTFGMRYAIDIAFVSEQGIVQRSVHDVEPGRLLACRKAAFVLERPHDEASAWPEAGAQLSFSMM